MMANVRSKNTAPEMRVRRRLHANGLRFRLHRKDLPGSPDIVLPGRRTAIFVHGCFWHGHDCPKAKLPGTRQEFWAEKINGNRRRDELAVSRLREAGWHVETVWECQITNDALDELARGLRGLV